MGFLGAAAQKTRYYTRANRVSKTKNAMATAVIAVIAVAIAIVIIIIWRHAAARRTKSGFNLQKALVNKYKKQQKLNKYMASIKGDKGLCGIRPYGKDNAVISCLGLHQMPVMKAQTPDGTFFKPKLEFINGAIGIIGETYAEVLADQIPGTWSAPVKNGSKISGGCKDPLYENGFLTAYCATGNDHHGWAAGQDAQLSIIEYPTKDVPLRTPLGNNHGHLEPEI